MRSAQARGFHALHVFRSGRHLRASVTPSSSAAWTVPKLLDLVQGTSYGAAAAKDVRRQVLEAVEELKQQPAAAPPTAPLALAGSWRLLYTTEADVHKIVDGLLLGASVADIRQDINLSSQRVTNIIELSQLGAALRAGAPLTAETAARICYKFDSLRVTVLGLTLPLPPVGGGWTECVAFDARLGVRVMQNSRGDTLILLRVGEAA